jgi:hypothetical protein
MSSYSDNPLLGYESIANITQNSINHNELIVDTDISIILLKVHAYSSGGAAGYVNLKIKPNGCISKLRIYSPSDTGGDGGYHGNNGGSDGGGGGDAVSVTCVLKDDERTDGYENNIIAVIGGGGGNGGAHGNSGKKGGNTSLGGDIFGDFYLIKGETGTDSWGYGGLGGNQTANSPYVAKSTWSRDFAGGQVSSGGEGGRGGPFVYDGQTISGGTNYIYTSAGEYGRDHQGTGFGGAGGGGGAYAWRDYGDTKASEDSELLPPYYLSINCGGGGGGSIGGNDCGGGGGGSIGGNDCGGGGGGAGFAGGNGGGGGKEAVPTSRLPVAAEEVLELDKIIQLHLMGWCWNRNRF